MDRRTFFARCLGAVVACVLPAPVVARPSAQLVERLRALIRQKKWEERARRLSPFRRLGDAYDKGELTGMRFGRQQVRELIEEINAAVRERPGAA